MAKANPKKWFPSQFTARIDLRKVDKWAERQKADRPYFDTWGDAHAQSVAWAAAALHRAKQEADAAKRAISSAHKRIQKVADLKQPNVVVTGAPR